MTNATAKRAPRNKSQSPTSTGQTTTIRRSNPDVTTLRSDKITDSHLQRLAIVYVRQSTQQQVLQHRESTARQYALADRAVALGWPAASVEVIDEDQGHSGSSAEGRSGFQRLLAEISSDRVGVILGLEMSRFARSCKDWQTLAAGIINLSETTLREWLHNPEDLKPGNYMSERAVLYQDGPAKLSDEEIDALIGYLLDLR